MSARPENGGTSGTSIAALVAAAEALVPKYDVAVPCDTSFPTAPDARDHFDAEDWAEALEESNDAARPLSIYVHLPFGRRLRLFCGCHPVVPRGRDPRTRYLEHLEREIDAVAERIDPSRRAVELHFGGGTPTFFSPKQLERLYVEIADHFRLDEAADIGVELDPRATDAGALRTLRRLGFNRVSLGVHDFDPAVQRAIGRRQTLEETRDVFERCRAERFASVNLDLVYGLPGLTENTFAKTLDRVVDIAPDRVVLHGFAHVPWVKKQHGVIVRGLPSPAENLRLFGAALARFHEAGYSFVGFDHFVRPDDPLARAWRDGTLGRSFQGYTARGDLDVLGLGPSARSATELAYAQNARPIEHWEQAVDRSGLATARGVRWTADDFPRRAVISRLLCVGRVSKPAIEREFAIRFDDFFAAETPRIEALRRDGLVATSASAIVLTPLGRLFAPVVASAFDARPRASGRERRFSRAV
jgi:oxygen-independent coproporphyrinogen-3 oxidase